MFSERTLFLILEEEMLRQLKQNFEIKNTFASG